MTRVAVALLAVMAGVALAVLALGGGSARADGGDDVRIIARMASDQRIEFGAQVNGASVLPERRFVRASIAHSRWLRSTPIELGGGRSGRIVARRLADGRFEVGLRVTGIDELLLPRQRHVPAGFAGRGWQRSSAGRDWRRRLRRAARLRAAQRGLRPHLRGAARRRARVLGLERIRSARRAQRHIPVGQLGAVAHLRAARLGRDRLLGRKRRRANRRAVRALPLDQRGLRPHLRRVRDGRAGLLGKECLRANRRAVGLVQGGRRGASRYLRD